MEERVIWGIHAGRTGDAHSLFQKKNVIAIGWSKVGDLSGFAADREEFKTKISAAYPEMKPGAIPVSGGQLFRFVHEMKAGDFVVYPGKFDKQIHVGEIVGEYTYDTSMVSTYPNRRSVKWLNSFPRTKFSQGALYEIGSALSLFQVKNYADEFFAVLEGKEITLSESEDETLAFIADEIEQVTRDFIIKTLFRELKGHPFAEFFGHLLNTMGYKTRVSPEGPDRGIDIVAHKDELGFEPPIIKVQVKSTEGNVGDPVLSALFGKVEQNEFGLFVTLSDFTKQAYNFAESKSNLRLINGDEVVNLIFAHYDQLDSRYKGILPLKRVFVPEALPEQEE